MNDALASQLSLHGQAALVTGGATGIGEGIAHVLADAGASVTVADVDLEGAQRVARDVAGGWVDLDVTDPDEVTAAIGSLEQIDILVNNAGTYREAGSILDQTHESWRRSIEVNLAGVFNCSKPFATRLVAEGRPGTIVNISSVDGYLPCLGSGYDSAKAGVIHMTKSLALDLAPHGIRVNGVAPGHVLVDTLRKMRSGELPALWPSPASASGLMGPLMRQRSSNIPIGRSGTPHDIAMAVLFLCSSMAGYVLGHTIIVDGGWTLA